MASTLYSLARDLDIRVLELKLPIQLDVITFDDLNTDLVGMIEASPGDFIIDLAQTDYVGSAVLGLLVNIRSRVKRTGGRLVLCNLSSRIKEIFRVGALESLFTITSTRSEAVEKLRPGN
jgi:stage II sporulation protein AA (anti-sigma F factor antagonist)